MKSAQVLVIRLMVILTISHRPIHAECKRGLRKLSAAARKAALSNDYGTAYRKALTGWQQVNAYSKQDEKCRNLAQTLLKHLEQYGEKANQAAGVVDAPPPSYKTLILKQGPQARPFQSHP